MDSLTHIAVGACIGDLFLGKKIGKKAMLYGAIASSLPDIDFIAAFWLDTTDNLLAHRGITHSFLFGVAVVAGMAFLFRHRHRIENIPIKTWLIFMGSEISSHLFLDIFNAYGIGLLEPFNHTRYSLNIIFVADPFFSVWPGIAATILIFLNRHNSKRSGWAGMGLACCSLYLLYCIYNKFRIDQDARYTLVHRSVQYKRHFTTPTPFNNWLWYVVAETDSGYDIGFRSVFDREDLIKFHFFPKKEELLKPFQNQKDLQNLIRFSQGYYTADSTQEGVVFSDLRFGQMMGWQNPKGLFVFHYFLQKPESNGMVVQRGRFANWNRETIAAFIHRIRGN